MLLVAKPRFVKTPYRQNRAVRGPDDRVCIGPEDQPIEGIAPLNAHHDQFGSTGSGGIESLPSRPAFADQNIYRAICARFSRNQPLEILSTPLFSHLDVPGRQHQVRRHQVVEHMEQREFGVGFLSK